MDMNTLTGNVETSRAVEPFCAEAHQQMIYTAQIKILTCGNIGDLSLAEIAET
jgi:hypothetical protein